jgi:hypothetical protein
MLFFGVGLAAVAVKGSVDGLTIELFDIRLLAQRFSRCGVFLCRPTPSFFEVLRHQPPFEGARRQTAGEMAADLMARRPKRPEPAAGGARRKTAGRGKSGLTAGNNSHTH